MERSANGMSSLEFMITDQGGSNGCKNCRKILEEGAYIVYVRYNGADYFRLGIPEEERPVCCGEKKNGLALFDSYGKALACIETYEETFRQMPVGTLVTDHLPLLPLATEDVPKNILEWRIL